MYEGISVNEQFKVKQCMPASLLLLSVWKCICFIDNPTAAPGHAEAAVILYIYILTFFHPAALFVKVQAESTEG